MAAHSQFGEEARPHLCIDKLSRPTPAHRDLSLIQVVRGKPIPTGQVQVVIGLKAQSLDIHSHHFVIHFDSSTGQQGCLVRQGRPVIFA